MELNASDGASRRNSFTMYLIYKISELQWSGIEESVMPTSLFFLSGW